MTYIALCVYIRLNVYTFRYSCLNQFPLSLITYILFCITSFTDTLNFELDLGTFHFLINLTYIFTIKCYNNHLSEPRLCTYTRINIIIFSQNQEPKTTNQEQKVSYQQFGRNSSVISSIN